MINISDNDYRWRRVEEYLISQGYVLKNPNRDHYVWMDCVSNGRDISYHRSNGPDDMFSSEPEGVFSILSSPSLGREVWIRVATIKHAVIRSRDNPRW